MNELILLGIFYNEMKARGSDLNNVFLSVDSNMVTHLKETYDIDITIEALENAARTCIASRWLERTTADPYFNYLSMTESGLKKFLDSNYQFLEAR